MRTWAFAARPGEHRSEHRAAVRFTAWSPAALPTASSESLTTVTITGLVLLGKTILPAISSDRLHNFKVQLNPKNFPKGVKKKKILTHFLKNIFLREGEKKKTQWN